MIHTYTVIKEGIVINHLSWEEARAISQDGDTILTIKDNHVSNVRKVEANEREKDMYCLPLLFIPHYQ